MSCCDNHLTIGQRTVVVINCAHCNEDICWRCHRHADFRLLPDDQCVCGRSASFLVVKQRVDADVITPTCADCLQLTGKEYGVYSLRQPIW